MATAGAQNGNGSRATGTNGSPAGWPGVWGPHRNGTAAGPGLPSGSLAFTELWRRRTDGGYSEVTATRRGAGHVFVRNLEEIVGVRVR